MSTENLLYEAAGVQVTKSLVRFSNQTFPTAAISAVSFGQSRPILWPPLGVIGIGALFLFLSEEVGVGAFVVLTLLAIAWLAWDRLRDRPYYVVVTTAGGDVRALETEFEDEAREIVQGIEKALS